MPHPLGLGLLFLNSELYKLIYRREIDGLRALAVIPVIFFHAGYSVFSGGFVGVDVFFVISGYLITTIILAEKQSGKFSIVNFYERRARRILPPLFFLIVLCLPIAWVYMDPYELKEFGQSILATTFFSSNVYFYLKSGYFDTANELKPLLHTWSLGVEEQYYLLFPLLLHLTWRLGRCWIVLLLAVIAIMSLALAHWWVYDNPSAVFFLLPTRTWELLIGAFIAFYFAQNDTFKINNLISQVFSCIGFLLILYSIFYFDKKTPFPSLYALIPTIGAGLIIVFATPATAVGKLLGSKLFTSIGLISYSAYLWHQPLLSFFRIYNLEIINLTQSTSLIFLTLFFAFFTKICIEDYFRYSFLKKRTFIFLTLSILVSMLFAFVGYSIHKNLGYPERSDLNTLLAQNYGLSSSCSGAPLSEKACKTSEQPNILLWGDSYAMHLANAINIASSDSLIQATLSDCQPIIGLAQASIKSTIACDKYNDKVFNELLNLKKSSISTVIFSSTFGSLTNSEAIVKFTKTISSVSKLGYKVVIVSPTPTNGAILKCIKLKSRLDKNYDSCSFSIHQTVNANIFTILKNISDETGVRYIDLRDFLCQDGVCKVSIDGNIMYRDDGHLSNKSKEYISRMFIKSINFKN